MLVVFLTNKNFWVCPQHNQLFSQYKSQIKQENRRINQILNCTFDIFLGLSASKCTNSEHNQWHYHFYLIVIFCNTLAKTSRMCSQSYEFWSGKLYVHCHFVCQASLWNFTSHFFSTQLLNLHWLYLETKVVSSLFLIRILSSYSRSMH